MKTKNLTIVASGDYSEYRVLAAFEDEADAKAWVAAMSKDENVYYTPVIGSLDLVPKGTKPKKMITHTLQVELWDDMTMGQERYHSYCEWAINMNWGVPPRKPVIRFVRAPCHNDTGGRLEIRGASESAVRSEMAKYIAAWRAGTWKTDKNINE